MPLRFLPHQPLSIEEICYSSQWLFSTLSTTVHSLIYLEDIESCQRFRMDSYFEFSIPHSRLSKSSTPNGPMILGSSHLSSSVCEHFSLEDTQRQGDSL